MLPRQFLACISSPELAELLAYDRIEPIGRGRTNLEIAGLTAALINIKRDPRAMPDPVMPEQLVPFHRSLPKSDEEIAAEEAERVAREVEAAFARIGK